VSSSRRPRCYLASPLGFGEPGQYYYKQVYIPTLSEVVEPVDPWALATGREIEQARNEGTLRETMLDVGRRNARAIRSSVLLAALLDGQELDAGTVAELGYAAALGKRCFGLRSDVRQTGDEGVVVNLQIEAFVVDSGGAILSTLAELVVALRRAAEEI
jgi:nucleoside 2-deoxyribosyltransferase